MCEDISKGMSKGIHRGVSGKILRKCYGGSSVILFRNQWKVPRGISRRIHEAISEDIHVRFSKATHGVVFERISEAMRFSK